MSVTFRPPIAQLAAILAREHAARDFPAEQIAVDAEAISILAAGTRRGGVSRRRSARTELEKLAQRYAAEVVETTETLGLRFLHGTFTSDAPFPHRNVSSVRVTLR